jgi:hypothetical protein
VNDDLARLAPRLLLKTNAEPAVRFVVLLETSRRNRVGKNEKCALVAEFVPEPLEQEIVFVVEHGGESLAADVTIGWTVDRVAKGHVVGGHRLRDRPGRAANVEKSPRDFLSGADLRERAVLLSI